MNDTTTTQTGEASEIASRHERLRELMQAEELDAVLSYGSNKLRGAVRYLAGFAPDRAGWFGLSPDHVVMAEGAVAAVPAEGDASLLISPGLTLSTAYVPRVYVGSWTSTTTDGLNAANILDALDGLSSGRVGIDSWEIFPAPLYLELTRLMPQVEFVPTKLVEELRLSKSPYELDLMRSAARTGDEVHGFAAQMLRETPGMTELEFGRHVEGRVRSLNPIYEDSLQVGPFMICSGNAVANELLHLPQSDKVIADGDIVHWDIANNHRGYTIDTSRTRKLGTPTADEQATFEAVTEVFETVVAAMQPGFPAGELNYLAQRKAKELGHDLWMNFLGHGNGIDAHERPDIGLEMTPLAEDMVIAIEPRLVVGGRYIVGHEDMIQVTASGGKSLNEFPKGPLEL